MVWMWTGAAVEYWILTIRDYVKKKKKNNEVTFVNIDDFKALLSTMFPHVSLENLIQTQRAAWEKHQTEEDVTLQINM